MSVGRRGAKIADTCCRSMRVTTRRSVADDRIGRRARSRRNSGAGRVVQRDVCEQNLDRYIQRLQNIIQRKGLLGHNIMPGFLHRAGYERDLETRPRPPRPPRSRERLLRPRSRLLSRPLRERERLRLRRPRFRPPDPPLLISTRTLQ